MSCFVRGRRLFYEAVCSRQGRKECEKIYVGIKITVALEAFVCDLFFRMNRGVLCRVHLVIFALVYQH